MRKIKCKCCGEILDIEEDQDEIACPNCYSFHSRRWHIGLNYKKLLRKHKIIMVKKIWDLYGGELRFGEKYAYINRDNKLAYKIDIDTGIVVGGHQAPDSVENFLFDALNEEEEIEEIKIK